MVIIMKRFLAGKITSVAICTTLILSISGCQPTNTWWNLSYKCPTDKTDEECAAYNGQIILQSAASQRPHYNDAPDNSCGAASC